MKLLLLEYDKEIQDFPRLAPGEGGSEADVAATAEVACGPARPSTAGDTIEGAATEAPRAPGNRGRVG